MKNNGRLMALATAGAAASVEITRVMAMPRAEKAAAPTTRATTKPTMAAPGIATP